MKRSELLFDETRVLNDIILFCSEEINKCILNIQCLEEDFEVEDFSRTEIAYQCFLSFKKWLFPPENTESELSE